MRHARLALTNAFLMLTLVACGRVEQVGFVSPSRMAEDPPGLNFDLGYLDERAVLGGKTLNVRVLDPSRTLIPAMTKTGKDEYNWESLRRNYEAQIADLMWRTRVFSDVSADSDPDPVSGAQLRLDVAITGWDEGSGWVRYIFPSFLSAIARSWFDTGATRLQVEGRMIDTATGNAILEFADARLHPGGPGFGPLAFKPFKSRTLLGESLISTARSMADSFREIARVDEKMLDKEETRPMSRPAPQPPQPAPTQAAPTAALSEPIPAQPAAGVAREVTAPTAASPTRDAAGFTLPPPIPRP